MPLHLKSDIGVARCSGECFNVADVRYACDIHYKALKTETEARVVSSAVFTKLGVPPIIIGIETEARVCFFELVKTLLTL